MIYIGPARYDCRVCGERYHTVGGLEAHQFVKHSIPMSLPVTLPPSPRTPIQELTNHACGGCSICPCTHTRPMESILRGVPCSECRP